MSDPSGISSIGKNTANAQGKGQVVQIVSLPEGLEQNARAIRLEGEVVQQNKDGTVRLSTLQGDIDIAVRGRQPQQGQHIEIDIPPGNPPRQATIRQAPAQAPAPQPPAPPSSDLPDAPATPPPLPQTPTTRPVPDNATVPPRTDGATPPQQAPATPPKIVLPQQPQPVDFYKPSQDATTAKPLVQTQQPLPQLITGQTIKLIPAATNEIPVGTESKPEGLAQAKPTNLVSTLLQTVKSAIPQGLMPTKPVLPVNAGSQIQPAQITTNGLVQTPILQNGVPAPTPTLLFAKIISIELPTGQITTLPTQGQAQTTPGNTGTLTPIQPLTVTIKTITPQGQALIPIPMDDNGSTKNFLIQAPSGNIPIGTKMTFVPQLANQIVNAPTNLSATPNTALQTNIPSQTMQTIPQAVPSLITAPPSTLPPAWRPLLPLMQASTIWPAMDDLFQAFYQATPQAAQILGRIVPSPAHAGNFGPALMLFAAAMKSGDLQAWLGDKKFDMLQKLGKSQLATRLSGETSSLAGNTDASATEWKSLPIPLLWQNEISKIMFHVRKEPSEDGRDAKDSDQTRFVMDLSLTRMGDVQLDGMIRGKQVDLIVRTQTPISFHMQDAMRTAYAKALDGTDIYGEIGFQSNIKEWAQIIKREENIKTSV